LAEDVLPRGTTAKVAEPKRPKGELEVIVASKGRPNEWLETKRKIGSVTAIDAKKTEPINVLLIYREESFKTQTASKIAKQAARIAGVLTLWADNYGFPNEYVRAAGAHIL
jgi:hypothetical protein